MNRLREQVTHYLRLRRSLGYKLVEHERFLNQFLDYLETNQAATITAENALAWAQLPTGVSARWHGARLSEEAFHPAVAQQINVIDRVRPSSHASHQRGDLRTGVGAFISPSIGNRDVLLSQMGQASRLGQAHHRHQTGRRHEVRLIEGIGHSSGSVIE